MPRYWRSFAVLATLLAGSTSASAQPDTSAASPLDGLADRRPTEIVIGADGVSSWMGHGGDMRFSVGIPKGERLSFEPFIGLYRGNLSTTGRDFFGSSYQPRGIYGLQIRQRIMKWQRPGVDPFITYGAMGMMGVACGRPVCPAGQAPAFVAPGLGLLGIGVQHNMGARAALRLEAQGGFFLFIPVGARVSAAFVVPFGRFPADGHSSR